MLGLHRLLRRWHARKGRLVVLPSVHSPQLDNRRDLYVYVPAAPVPGGTRYPVIYMQDGQNLFDPAMSFAGTWGVDETLTWASRRGLDAIVVGIPTTIASRPRRLAHVSVSSTPHVPAKLMAGSNRFCPSCM